MELCGDGFMDYIHRLKSKILKILKSQRFGSWIFFRSQVNEGAKQNRCSSLLPLHSPEDGSKASFRNVVILIF
jgi:hypothetical protein